MGAKIRLLNEFSNEKLGLLEWLLLP